jgi:hypothetical protein
MSGFVTVGGSLLADASTDGGLQQLQNHLSNMSQVANLALLVGAGASFDLGGPAIRQVSSAELTSLLAAGPGPLTASETDAVNPFTAEGPFDLEQVLAGLSHAASLAALMGGDLTMSGKVIDKAAFASARDKVAAAIVFACDIPKPGSSVPARLADDSLLAHRTLLRRLVRVRRRDLARPWIFTTNYDLLLEKSMDSEALPYIDGFTGTIDRQFSPQVYEQDIYVPQRLGDSRMLRLPDLLYLVKLHGSVNWRFDPTTARLLTRLGQDPRPSDLAVIYPTPLKEAESLGYPYADLMRVFSAVLARPDTALITVGYGFGDEHINRIINDQLTRNRSLQLCITSPSGVGKLVDASGTSSVEYEDSEIGRLAATPDRRISTIGGQAARFTDLALDIFPQPESSGGAEPGATP